MSQAVKKHASAGSSPAGEHDQFAELWRPDDGTPAYHGPEQVLLDHGQVTVKQLEAAARKQAERPHMSVLDLLVEANDVDAMVAMQAVAEYFNLPFMRVTLSDIDIGTFEMLPLEYIRQKKVIPVRAEGDFITVGISDPADIFLIDDLKHRLRKTIHLAVTPPEDILHVAEEVSANSTEKVEEIIKDITEDAVEVMHTTTEEVADLEKIAGESPVIRYVNYIIASAVRDGASDIHIEPTENRLRVRYRIDGVLFEQQAPPLQMHAAIISRLKIMANMDIAERRLPQDGRIRVTVNARTLDLRVSTLPITTGEKCVIRILDNRAILVGLENLGMWNDTLEAFRKEILQPHGVVLVTGPTGSGKSTTLYSALQIMDGDKLNIATVEEPVEYELDFANQVNVHEAIGLTFSASLRSLLRQDPDIIMIGEIRDAETARIAVQASLTGHLVLSTLHTNDAPSSITRLINIGIEPYLISASVNGVLAQRLVRRICQNCKTQVTQIQDHIAAYLKQYGADPEQLYKGVGCDKCRHTGYKGRLGIYEFMCLDDDLRDTITRNPALTELRTAARQKGMRPLREDGLQKVAAGMTTIEEVMRVTQT